MTTSISIQKLISLILKNDEYSSSKNRESFNKITKTTIPKNSKFKNREKIKIVLILFF